MAAYKEENNKIQPAPEKRFWLCYGTEEFLVREDARQVVDAYLTAGFAQSDVEYLEGPVPDMGALVTACGAISLFGGVRLVVVQGLDVAAMKDKDVEELCGIVEELENAVLVCWAVLKDKKALETKKTKKLVALAQTAGGALLRNKAVKGAQTTSFVESQAKAAGAAIAPQATRALVESCGTDLQQLHSEVEKLAAGAGYGIITTETVQALATRNVEANVFDIVAALADKNSRQAFSILRNLLDEGQDEILICGALAASYVDMYRVKCGQTAGKNYEQVFKGMGYKGSPWRLKMSSERAAHYRLGQLEQAVFLLDRLNQSLKSSPVSHRLLLENALIHLMEV